MQVAKITGTAPNTTTTLVDVPVTVGKSSGGQISSEFRIKGSGIVASITGNAATPDELKAGRLTAVEIAVTVISDFGIDQMRKRPDLANNPTAFLAKNSYQYSKLIQLPSM